jgi:isochorismate pyruvate lyase
LRSESPAHRQSLRDTGAKATLVAALVREGKLWGLIEAHHHSPRHLRQPLVAAVDLLAEVASMRIAAIENYAHAQVALLVRRFGYMDAAARIKTDRNAVRDEARKAQVIANAAGAAAAAGIPEGAIAEMWETLVEASITHELAEWDRMRR